MDESDLFQKQVRAIDFMCEGEDTLLWADVGTGKTVMALTTMLRKGGRWIVFAPLRVANEVWVQEAELWDHLGSLNVATATSGPTSRSFMGRSLCDVVVTNYDNMKWWCESGLLERFDNICFDEVDKLKDPSTHRFKAIKKQIKTFDNRIGMTGTPTSNRLLDLWAQTYVVDGGESFGQSFYKFRKEYFFPSDYQQHTWKPIPVTTERMMMDKLSDITYRIEAEKWNGEPIELPPRYVELPKAARVTYTELEKDLWTRLDSGESISAANMAVLTGKLNQIAAGFSYVGEDEDRTTEWHTKAKFDELDSLISELQGAQLMIVYHFQAQLEELKRRYGNRLFEPTKVGIAAWNEGAAELLAIHPQSAGHGLNLQKSGAHHVVFLTLPWSAGLYQQVIGRLDRTGQANQVVVHKISTADTIDADIALTVESKVGEQSAILAHMRQRTEELYGQVA